MDYINIFSSDLAIEPFENTNINKHAIKLVESKQPLYEPTYTLSFVELKILKTYIKTDLKIRFIQSWKFSTDAPILFNKKPDRNFCVYVDYWDLNNFTIIN